MSCAAPPGRSRCSPPPRVGRLAHAVSSRSFAVAVPVVLTKCSRSPGTRRDMRYWTQSASPTHTGADVDRRSAAASGRRRVRRPASSGSSVAVLAGAQGDAGSPRPVQEKPDEVESLRRVEGGGHEPAGAATPAGAGGAVELELDARRGRTDGGSGRARRAPGRRRQRHARRELSRIARSAHGAHALSTIGDTGDSVREHRCSQRRAYGKSAPFCRPRLTRLWDELGRLVPVLLLERADRVPRFVVHVLQRRMWPVVQADASGDRDGCFSSSRGSDDHVVGVLLVERLELRPAAPRAGRARTQMTIRPCSSACTMCSRSAATPRRCRPPSAPGSGGRASAARTCTG